MTDAEIVTRLKRRATTYEWQVLEPLLIAIGLMWRCPEPCSTVNAPDDWFCPKCRAGRKDKP